MLSSYHWSFESLKRDAVGWKRSGWYSVIDFLKALGITEFSENHWWCSDDKTILSGTGRKPSRPDTNDEDETLLLWGWFWFHFSGQQCLARYTVNLVEGSEGFDMCTFCCFGTLKILLCRKTTSLANSGDSSDENCSLFWFGKHQLVTRE